MKYLKYRMTEILKNIWAGALAVCVDMLFPMLIPIKSFLIFVFFAIIFDTITGILASKKRKQPITSKGIWRTVEKIMISFIVILLAEGVRVIWMPDIPLAFGVSFIIAIAEVKSNFENYAVITGIDIWTSIKSKINFLQSEKTDS